MHRRWSFSGKAVLRNGSDGWRLRTMLERSMPHKFYFAEGECLSSEPVGELNLVPLGNKTYELTGKFFSDPQGILEAEHAFVLLTTKRMHEDRETLENVCIETRLEGGE